MAGCGSHTHTRTHTRARARARTHTYTMRVYCLQEADISLTQRQFSPYPLMWGQEGISVKGQPSAYPSEQVWTGLGEWLGKGWGCGWTSLNRCTMVTVWTDSLTDTISNNTFPQFRWWTVTNRLKRMFRKFTGEMEIRLRIKIDFSLALLELYQFSWNVFLVLDRSIKVTLEFFTN